MRGWVERWYCPDCGGFVCDHVATAHCMEAFGKPCPNCGVTFNDHYINRKLLSRRVELWIDESVWWKPWTWRSGHWIPIPKPASAEKEKAL